MEKNLISIIIRTKNEERWIGLCIERIKKQTYKNFEIILVDSFSEDKTVEKAKRNGVEKIVEISLTEKEKKDFKYSVDSVRELFNAAKKIDSSLA